MYLLFRTVRDIILSVRGNNLRNRATRARNLYFSFYCFHFCRSSRADSFIELGAREHRYVKRIYKSRNVCRAMYTRRTALSLKKISRDAYARLCACTREVLRAHTFVDSVSRSSTQWFSIIYFPIAFLSPCPLTHSFPQYRGLSKPVHAKRFITMTLRQWNHREYRGLNKRFHNLTVFINDLSLFLCSLHLATPALSLTVDERCSISVPSRFNSRLVSQLSFIFYLQYVLFCIEAK